MPQKTYIYSDNWRNCEGRHGVNQGGESGTLIGVSADHRMVPLRGREDARGRGQLYLLPDPDPVQLAVTKRHPTA